MNFDQFLAEHGPVNDALRALMAAAWDTALCSAQAASVTPDFQLRSAGEIAAALSELHTWNSPKP